jgi:hypothetical protein
VSEQNSHLEQMGLGLRLDRPEPDTIPTQLGGESYVHELISGGAPLPEVLDRLCSAINVEIGNVASVVLLADCQTSGPPGSFRGTENSLGHWRRTAAHREPPLPVKSRS